MPARLAAAVAVVSGAAVLVVEILVVRLVAPYVGLTLEAYTAAIAAALAGIALGARLGGAAADRVRPVTVVVAGLGAGGVAVLAVRPGVHLLGPAVASGGPSAALVLVAVTTLPAVTLLSAVAPAVVAARLERLEQTGSVVGRLSALGTVGALAGSVLTGFVLVAAMPTSAVLAVTGGVVLALAAAVALVARRARPGGRGDRRHRVLAVAGLVAAGGLLAVPGPCEVETAYSCARIVPDPERPTGRVLVLDDLRHSYVDVADPTHLEFSYVRRFAAAVDGWYGREAPLRAVHVGGGALTVPRWLAATRPGSDQVVLEIDAAVLDLVRAELGTPPGTRLVEGDARVTLTALPPASADLVVGDAFGSVAVPWHLATTQAAQQVRRVLRPGGLYVLNVIDRGDLALLRAEVATLRQVFGDVAVLAEPGTTRPGAEGAGGNVVLLAARGGVDAVRLDDVRVAAGDGVEVRLVTDDDPLAGGRVLTDDFAPTDQLLTPAVAPRG